MANPSLSFSIIMPCYNSSAYLRDALDSLVGQSYPNWELIAVNDGSKDDTLAILQEYAAKDNRIKIFTKTNGGYATAVNFGLDKIQGDYFLMMGSDDRLAPNLFESLNEEANQKRPDVIAFRAMKYKGKETLVDKYTDFDTPAYLENATVNEFVDKYSKQAMILSVRDTAKCFKKEKLGNLRYFGKKGIDADGIFSTLFVHRCHSFMSIPILGYLWTIREGSVSSKTNLAIDMERISNWIQFNHAVLSEKDYRPTVQDSFYLIMAQHIGRKLLAEEKRLSLETLKMIQKGRKAMIQAAKKFSLTDDLPKNALKKAFFVHFPLLWSAYYRRVTKKTRA